MIPVLYLVVTAISLRNLKPSAANSNSLLYPALRLLILVHSVLLAAQMVSMTQVHRMEVFESMALAPLLVYYLSLKRGESSKLNHLPHASLHSRRDFGACLDNDPLLSDKAAEHAASVFLHIFLAMTGFASFMLATLCALIYLWQSFLLKAHPTALVIMVMPNLRDLNTMQWRTLQVGIVLLTLGIGLAKLSPYLWDIPSPVDGQGTPERLHLVPLCDHRPSQKKTPTPQRASRLRPLAGLGSRDEHLWLSWSWGKSPWVTQENSHLETPGLGRQSQNRRR